jgi:hypothetical protein
MTDRLHRGWDLFETNDPSQRWMIQRCDDLALFDSDDAALDYICSTPCEARQAIAELLRLLNRALTTTTITSLETGE